MKAKSVVMKGFVSGVISSLKSEAAAKHAVPKVEAFLNQVTQKAWDENTANVEVATTISDHESEKLGEILSRLTGREMKLKVSIKEGLIAGMRIAVGEWIIDTSIANQLARMEQILRG